MAKQALRKEKGQFNGSVGQGASNAPTAAPTSAPATASAGSAPGVYGARPTLNATCARYTDTIIDGTRQICGSPVTGGGDWCRLCPGYKKNKAPKDAATTNTNTAPVDGAIPVAEVVRCASNVLDPRTNENRQCKRAVRAPETKCFDHGGDPNASLGKTFAKAQAEAQRGELLPPSEEDRKTDPDYARAMMERDLQDLVTNDPTAFLEMASRFASYDREHSMGRFSPGNQMTVLGWAYHMEKEADPDADQKELLKRAFARCDESLHTKAGWAKLGRVPNGNASAIPVLYYSPNVSVKAEVDEATGKEVEVHTYKGARFGAKLQYFASDTQGDPLPERPTDPLEQPLPPGYGNPEGYRNWLGEQAEAAGVKIVVDNHPPASGAKAYFVPRAKEIHLYVGHAGGDQATHAHVLAHELGHALDDKLDQAAYASRGCNERGRAEVFAETFAYLLTARHGFDATSTSSGYATGWARQIGGLGSKEAASVMRDALTKAHQVLFPASK
mgnify:CR=1 FL=1|jgi:hypothetical protein